MPEASRLQQVAAALQAYRFLFSNEEELQAGVAQALEAAGLSGFEREVTLAGGIRLDLFEEASGIAVECKVDGTPQQLARQVQRYLTRPEISGVLIVCRPGLGRYAAACAPERVLVVEAGGLL